MRLLRVLRLRTYGRRMARALGLTSSPTTSLRANPWTRGRAPAPQRTGGGNPRPTGDERLTGAGATVDGTDSHGSVTVTSDGAGYRFVAA